MHSEELMRLGRDVHCGLNWFGKKNPAIHTVLVTDSLAPTRPENQGLSEYMLC